MGVVAPKKVVLYTFHDATTVLTVYNSCLTGLGFEQKAREFSLMLCGTPKKCRRNIVNMCNNKYCAFSWCN